MIVSNPPYISAEEMQTLAPDVRDHEPHLALTPGETGLEAYRIIAQHAPRHMSEGGRILLEIGPSQGDAVSAMLRNAGLRDVSIQTDLDGRDRVVCAVK